MKKKLLYIAHRLPYPPNKGDKIPSYNMLRFFSKTHDVYLGTFIDIEADWQYVDKVRAFCADTCILGINPRLAKLRSLKGLLTGEPLSLPYYYSEAMQDWVDRVIEDVRPDEVLLFSGVTAQYVTGRLPAGTRSLIDFIDVDSDKWRLYAERHAWPMSWVYARESRKLLAFERAMAAEFDASIFVSEKEAAYFQSLAPEVAGKVHWRVQGVDSAFFDPQLAFDSPYQPGQRVMVFVGAMDYWPNIDAVSWFAEAMFPAIREQVADAVFCIVGMNPTEQVRRLAEIDGIVVTGSVDDVRPYMAYAHCSVAPLRVARGIQNKVLEAMAMGNPVVATDNALNGIDFYDYTPRRADDEQAFVKACVEVLGVDDPTNTPGMDLQARQLVLDHYNWDSSLQKVADLLSG